MGESETDEGRSGSQRILSPPAPRIADVAAASGVSTATVSRALADPASVRTETRERVLAAVHRLGYTPNAAARNLRARRSMMAMVFVPRLSNPFFSEVIRGIDTELAANGYGLIVGDLDNTTEKERHLADVVFAGHIDGILVMWERLPERDGRLVTEAGLPAVGVVAMPEGGPVRARVVIDDASGLAEAVEHLLGLGHRHIAYLGGPDGNFNESGRRAGFARALRAAGLDPADMPAWNGDFRFASGEEAARAFLALPRRPTAIACASDEMAIGFVRAVREAGLDVPGEVSVTGFDGLEFGAYCWPPLTTVEQPRFEMGKAGARLLLERMRGTVPAEAAETIVLPTRFCVRGSTAAPRA